MSDTQASAPDSLKDTHVLQRTAGHLAERFAGIFAPEMVERYVFESYATLGRTARIRTYLAATAGHFAADRLRALAQSMGRIEHDRPQVLFVCVHNAGRSQMAAALLAKHSGGSVEVRSAGSLPGPEVNPLAIQVLREAGAELQDAYPKPLTDDVVRAADVVVTMGCGDTCPIYPGKRYLDWDVADPAGATPEQAREILADIDARVQVLLMELRAGE